MGIRVSWDNDEHTALLFTFEGRWDLNDFYAGVKEGNGLMDSAHQPVHSIFDLTRGNALPPGFVGAIRSIGAKPHAQMGQMAVVGANTFVTSFVNLFGKLLPDNTKSRRAIFAATLDDARAKLAAANKTIESA